MASGILLKPCYAWAPLSAPGRLKLFGHTEPSQSIQCGQEGAEALTVRSRFDEDKGGFAVPLAQAAPCHAALEIQPHRVTR